MASPTYKGTYTGLLKVFLDRLDYQALSSVIALPMLVGGCPTTRSRLTCTCGRCCWSWAPPPPRRGWPSSNRTWRNLALVLDPWAGRVAAALGRCAALAAPDRTTVVA